MNKIKRIVEVLTLPFTKEILFFCVLLYCSCIAFAVYEPAFGGVKLAVYFIVLGYLISYVLSVFVGLLGGACKKIVIAFLSVIGVLNLIADVVVYTTTENHWYKEHVALIMESNPSEGREFLAGYLNSSVIMDILLFLFGLVIIVVIIAKLKRSYIIISFGKIIGIGSLIMAGVLCLFTNIISTDSWDVVSYGKIVGFIKYSPAPDLSKYRQNVVVECAYEEDTPDNIVVLIGESFARNHSSLYSYDKDTNPLLKSLPVFSYKVEHAISPETTTIPALIKILTTYSSKNEGSVDWKTCLTIFDIAKAAGYRTYWISNQSRIGVYGNTTTRLAELADTCIWAGFQMGSYKSDYDGILLPYTHSAQYVDKTKKNLIFIHLSGSHVDYSERYPQEFSHFSEEDYSDLPPNQRRMISEYDNSILYNDWVVSNIITDFADFSSVLFYFPDHGEDVYVSRPDYCGHAIVTDPKSIEASIQIPMLEFVSNVCVRQNSDNTFGLNHFERSEFNTEDVIYVISKAMGVTRIDDIDITNVR